MNMRLCSILLCCVICSGFVATAGANELEQLQSRFQTGQGDAAKILQDINAYLQRTPSDFQAIFLKARLLERTGLKGDAKGLYRGLIEKRPSAPAAYNNLARLLTLEGDIKGAQALLEKAMRTNPAYLTVYENLTQIYAAMARDSYSRALQINTSPRKINLLAINNEIEATANLPAASTVKLSGKIKQMRVSTSRNTPTSAPVNSVEINRSKKQQPIADAAVNRNEVITTLEGWAAAWSEQATDVYFIFYADDYHPPGMSRGNWKKERRVRLQKPSWIEIGLKNIDVKSLTRKEATVELIQEYRASNFNDKTRKEFMLRQTSDGWRIVAERNIAKIN